MQRHLYSVLIPLSALLGLLGAARSGAETLNVAVASNFYTTMQALVSPFEQHSGHRLQLSTGSSGKLTAQIVQGAPYDVFFSADQEKPDYLIEQGLAHSKITYAVGQLVLWAPNADQQVDQDFIYNTQPERIALANPKLAPYGKAAEEVLQSLQPPLQRAPTRITGENVAQAFHFITTGNVAAGFIAQSQLADRDYLEHHVWPIPQALYTPIKQDAVVITHSQKQSAALSLLQFMQSPQALAVLKKKGYSKRTGD